MFLSTKRGGTPSIPEKPSAAKVATPRSEQLATQTVDWLKNRTASEVLGRLDWKSNPEKIVLMGAFHEASGADEGWKKADIEARFSQARETFPANFSRDIALAIDSGLVGAVSARSYKIGRVAWNKIDEAIAELEAR